ncbi:hypothetical protein EC988_006402, partial [Linderina pennispora]
MNNPTVPTDPSSSPLSSAQTLDTRSMSRSRSASVSTAYMSRHSAQAHGATLAQPQSNLSDPSRTPELRGTKRNYGGVEGSGFPHRRPSDMLATLAELSTRRIATAMSPVSRSRSPPGRRARTQFDNTLKAYSLSSQTMAASAPSSSASSAYSPSMAAAKLTARLVFDARSHLPAKDIMDELVGHTVAEFNIVGKMLHPGNFMKQYRRGKVSSLLALCVMANNAMFSRHPAIVDIGPVEAARRFVDRAKVFVADVIERPDSSSCAAIILLSLKVYKLDDSVWSDEELWVSESWLEREEMRRLIWGSFTVDTFVSLMLHQAPN